MTAANLARAGGGKQLSTPIHSTINKDIPMNANSWREHVKVHPAADLFPMMSDEELNELGNDIAENNLKNGVVLWTPEQLGKTGRKGPKEVYLLDGRSRLEAIERAFKDDPERQAEAIANALYIDRQPGCATLLYGDDDPFAYVVSANVRRRHLSAEDKRDLIIALLKANPERSDRSIAKIADSNRTTAGQIRRDLEQKGDVSIIDTRIDSAGRQQPARKPPRPPKISKEAQIRALREQKPVVVRPLAAAQPPTDDVNALQALLLTLRGDPRRIAGIPLDKRISMGRTCLAWLNLTPDDLRAP
jgi:hypothetical protein